MPPSPSNSTANYTLSWLGFVIITTTNIGPNASRGPKTLPHTTCPWPSTKHTVRPDVGGGEEVGNNDPESEIMSKLPLRLMMLEETARSSLTSVTMPLTLNTETPDCWFVANVAKP